MSDILIDNQDELTNIEDFVKSILIYIIYYLNASIQKQTKLIYEKIKQY